MDGCIALIVSPSLAWLVLLLDPAHQHPTGTPLLSLTLRHKISMLLPRVTTGVRDGRVGALEQCLAREQHLIDVPLFINSRGGAQTPRDKHRNKQTETDKRPPINKQKIPRQRESLVLLLIRASIILRHKTPSRKQHSPSATRSTDPLLRRAQHRIAPTNTFSPNHYSQACR